LSPWLDLKLKYYLIVVNFERVGVEFLVKNSQL
jgi:hypothetical protein